MNTNEPYVCVSSHGMLSIAYCVDAYFSQAVCLMADYLIQHRTVLNKCCAVSGEECITSNTSSFL